MQNFFWRLTYRLAYPLARIWWRLSGARHQGAIAAIYVQDKLLILQSSYRSEWCFPGGGINPGETPEAAARREIWEELGFHAAALRQAGIGQGRWNGRHETVYFFELHLPELPRLKLDQREILAARLIGQAELQTVCLTDAVRSYLAISGWQKA